MTSIRGTPLPMVTLGFASVGATFDSSDLTISNDNNPLVQIVIRNETDATVIVSLDGVQSHILLKTLEGIVLDYQRIGAVGVKHNGVAPTSGSVYITGFVE